MSDPRMQTQRLVVEPVRPRLVETVRLGPRELLCTSCWYAIERDSSSSCPACGSSPPASGWPSIPYSFRNRYAFVTQIECSALAAVFRGSSIGPAGGAELVVKVARGDGTPESVDIAKKAFRREATVAGLLSDESDAFVGVRGSDSEDPAYIALEHVPWPTLDVLFSQLGILSPADVARVGIAILRGVSFLEKKRLVHGHLFPRNIHASRRADDGFDIKIAGAGAEPPKPDDPAVGAQSPQAYMSPEQLAGDALDTASDIHTVASVLWELATGHLAWPLPEHGGSSSQRLTLLRTPPRKPDAMPGELHEILARALNFDPENRSFPGDKNAPPSAGSLAAGMERALQKFLSETARQQAGMRQKLDAVSQALTRAQEGLAPFSALLESARELDATLRHLRDEGDESKVSAQVEVVEHKVRDLVLAVDARRGRGGLESENPARSLRSPAPQVRAQQSAEESTTSPSPPAAASSQTYVYLTVASAIGGLLIGFFVGRAGGERQSFAGQPTAVPPAGSGPNGDTGQHAPTPSTASTSSSPAVKPPEPPAPVPSTTRTSTAEPTQVPTATVPEPKPAQTGVVPTPPPRLSGRLPGSDPYGDSKPVPKPTKSDDPY